MDDKAGEHFKGMYGLATVRIGERPKVIDDPNAHSDMGAQKTIDRIGFKAQGVA